MVKSAVMLEIQVAFFILVGTKPPKKIVLISARTQQIVSLSPLYGMNGVLVAKLR